MRFAAIVLMFFLTAGSVYALVDDQYIQIRDASNYDLYPPESKFLNQNPDPAEPGSYVEVRIKIENIGIQAARDLIFELVPEYPFSLDPGKDSLVRVGDAEARQVGEDAYVLYWKLRIDKDAVEGSNRLRMRYSYDDGRTWIDLTDYYVRIQTHHAILSLDAVESMPEVAAPGEMMKLKIDLLNMADSILKDIKVELLLLYPQGAGMVELPFTPIGSSNKKVIKQIAGGQMLSVEFDMMTDVNAPSGIYKIPMQIEYSDSLGKNYTSRGIVGLQVGQEPDLFVSIDRITSGTAGKRTDMTVRFVNKGNEDIKFLFAKIGDVEGLEFLSAQEVYIGNVDSDDFETEDFIVRPQNCDTTYKIPMEIEYQNAGGVKYKHEIQADFTVCSSNEDDSGSPAFIGFLVLIVIVIGAVFLYKRMKKSKKE